MEDMKRYRKNPSRNKAIALAVMNIAAAAAIGIIAGWLYKSYSGHGSRLNLEEMRGRMEAAADSVDACIGIGLIYGSDTLCIAAGSVRERETDNCWRFPMLSVFKFHQALAVCGWLKDSGTELSSAIEVAKGQLHENTWSPLRDSFPDGGVFTWEELLEYTLVWSDNNACDILFGLTGGPEYTDSYVRSLGTDGFRIRYTEAEMHENQALCHDNWSTPLSAVSLLEKFYRMRHSDEYSEFVWKTMSGCHTGQERIPAPIPDDGTTIAHKTGTGNMDPDGKIMAVNDIGIVELPDGRHYSIAVFITGAGCGPDECEKTIARISEIAYEYIR